MSEQEQPSNPDPEFSPGGIIPSPDGDTVLAWISPGEEYFTPGDLYRMWESYVQERDEGPIPE